MQNSFQYALDPDTYDIMLQFEDNIYANIDNENIDRCNNLAMNYEDIKANLDDKNYSATKENKTNIFTSIGNLANVEEKNLVFLFY